MVVLLRMSKGGIRCEKIKEIKNSRLKQRLLKKIFNFKITHLGGKSK